MIQPLLKHLLVPLILLLSVQCYAQDMHEEVSKIEQELDQIFKEIQALELWSEMQVLADSIPHTSRCAEYYERAKETHGQIRALNEQRVKGRVNNNYHTRITDLKEENRIVLKEYHACFESIAKRNTRVREATVSEYGRFKKRYYELEGRFGGGHFSDQLQKLTDRATGLKRLLQALLAEPQAVNIAMGEIRSLFRKVEVSRDGGQFVSASVGQALSVGDVIRTGERARVRIRLNDRDENLNVGPTMINLAANSILALTKFQPQFGAQRPIGLVDLIRGILRAFSKGWGSRSAFSVRSGTSLCGIRGTEIVASYNPQQDTARYWLHHGDAFIVDATGTQRTLAPGHVVEMQRGLQSSESRLVPADYASLILETSTDAGLTRTQAVAMAQIDFGRGPGVTVKSQSVSRNFSKGLKSKFSPANARQRLGLDARHAHRAFERLQNVVITHDAEAATKFMAGSYGEQFNNFLSEYGAASFRTKGWRPTAWTIECVHCSDPDTCYIYADMDTVSMETREYKNYTGIYFMKNMGDQWVVVDDNMNPGEQYQNNVAACSWR